MTSTWLAEHVDEHALDEHAVDAHAHAVGGHVVDEHAVGKERAEPSVPKRPMRTGGYIVSRGYDWAFFLLPPLVGLVLGIAVSQWPLAQSMVWSPLAPGDPTTPAALFIGALIHAHLVAVFFRSHGNAAIRRRHRIAFFVVPPVLFVALLLSTWLVVLSLAVATFWDVWHSGAQTFGFARIYERNAGTEPTTLRRLDFWLNQLLYAGPILAGASLMDHVAVFEDFGDLDDPLALIFARTPGAFEANAGVLTTTLLVLGSLFLIVYVVASLRARRAGHRVPMQKVVLLVVTGACSIYTWGFNSWGEAFFIMNFFHAVQYLALVWAVEGGRWTTRLRLDARPGGRRWAAAAFFVAIGAYGLSVELMDPSWHAFWAVTMVVSLMHFWYDAFIWSVRRAEV